MANIRPEYRVQIYAQTWTRDNKPRDAKWINFSYTKTLEAATNTAAFEQKHGRKARIQKFLENRYKTLDV